MSKTRPNRKLIKRLRQKQAFSVATQVKLLVEQLPNQQSFEAFLLQEADPLKRKRLFDYCKPFVKFGGATFPTTLHTVGGIVLTDKN